MTDVSSLSGSGAVDPSVYDVTSAQQIQQLQQIQDLEEELETDQELQQQQDQQDEAAKELRKSSSNRAHFQGIVDLQNKI